ncbi:MAG: sodium:calcium antiporter, partial [Eubacteriales bacterium]
EEKVPASRKILITNIAKFIIGALCIVLGSQLLVDNGSTLARIAGVPERVIGVTLIAVGTSLPELITAITAIIKKQSSLSIGNIFGANIIDLTLIMPLSALISGQALPVSSGLAQIDLPFCWIISLFAVVPAMICSKFSRWQGIVLLAAYAGYIVFTCISI